MPPFLSSNHTHLSLLSSREQITNRSPRTYLLMVSPASRDGDEPSCHARGSPIALIAAGVPLEQVVEWGNVSQGNRLYLFLFFTKKTNSWHSTLSWLGGGRGRTNARRPSSLLRGSAGIGEPFLLPLVNLITIIANKLNCPSDTGVAGK